MPTDFAIGDQVFPLLADPRGYVACQWELAHDTPRLAYWLDLFRTHFPSLLAETEREEADRGIASADSRRRAATARTIFEHYLDQLAEKPDRFGRLDILNICVQREIILRAASIIDPYRLPKTRENEVALACLPRLLAELDALPGLERITRLAEGIFAGNIFDLGAVKTAELFKDGSVDFHSVRGKLAPRPWMLDDLDAWVNAMNQRRYRAAVLFVDNAGSDVVLGMIPLARELLRRGTAVILTANTTPTLNDITHDELTVIVRRIAAWDRVIADGLSDSRLELVPSGNGLPLIDLKKIGSELVEAVGRRRPDLVVLEGMGRGVESNLHARFACDVLKIAMVKDRGVADELNGKMYDLVLRFEVAAR